MGAQVEQKHWWIQTPFSWGVEVALVLALLASVGVGVAQVRSRDAMIADQAAGISQQALTLQQAREQVAAQRRAAEVDEAIIQAYSRLPAQRTAMERALRGEGSEVYESYGIVAAAAEVDGAIIRTYAQLQAERTAMERALRGEDSEIYESYAVTAAAAERTRSRLELLAGR